MHKVDHHQRGPSSQGEANDLSTGFMVAFDQVKLVFFSEREGERESAEKDKRKARTASLSASPHVLHR